MSLKHKETAHKTSPLFCRFQMCNTSFSVAYWLPLCCRVGSITHSWTAERWTLAEGRRALLSLTYGECCRWPCYCQLLSDELLPQCAYVVLHSLPIKPSNATQCQSIRFTLHILMDFWVSYTVCYFVKGNWSYLKMPHVCCQDVCKWAHCNAFYIKYLTCV